MEITPAPPVADPHTVAEPQGNLLQDYERKFEQLLEDQKSSKLCSELHLLKRKTRWNEESMSWVYIASEMKKHPEQEGG